MTGICELCGRDVRHLTEHHLVPLQLRRKKEWRHKFGPTIDPCATCHGKINGTWDNKTLASNYDTIEKIRAAPELQPFLRWVRKQPGTRFSSSRRGR